VADERTLAMELDRALAGEAAADEARELAALLVAAAEPARVPVTDAELERALRATRPGLAPKRRWRVSPLLVAPAAVAAAAVVAAVLLVRGPGSAVQARAARAVDATFFVVERIRPARPSLFPATDVSGYVDGRNGRAHVRTGLSAETVVRSNGAVERWTAAGNVITFAPTCTVLPGGCSESLDPLALYLRTIETKGVRARRTHAGYELTLRWGRVEQTVVVDAVKYLPLRILSRQDGKLVSTTTFVVLERQTAPVSGDAWVMSSHPGARVVELTPRGRRVRVESVSPARPTAGLRWLGPAYEGSRAKVAEVRLTGGRAMRIRYGELDVWNYRRVAPPATLQGRTGAAKVFAFDGGVVHAYFGPSQSQVAVASFGDRNVAVVSRSGDKIDAVRAVMRLVVVRRPGSP